MSRIKKPEQPLKRGDVLSCPIEQLSHILSISPSGGKNIPSYVEQINRLFSIEEKKIILFEYRRLNGKLSDYETEFLNLLDDFYELYSKEDYFAQAGRYFLEHRYKPIKPLEAGSVKDDDDTVMQKIRDFSIKPAKTPKMEKSIATYQEIMKYIQPMNHTELQIDLLDIIKNVRISENEYSAYSDVEIFRMIYNNNALLLKFDEIIKNRIKYDEIKASLAAPVEEFLPLLENKRSLPQSQHSSIFNITHGELSGGDLVVSESTNVLKTTPTKTFCSDTTLAGSNSDAQCPSRGFDGEDDRFLRANRDRIIEFRVKKNNGLSLLLDELEVSTRNNTRLARSNKNGRPYLRPGFYSGEKNFTHEFEDKGSNDRGLLNPHGDEKWHPSILLGGEVCPLEKKLGNNHDKKYTVEHRSVRRKSIETGPQLNISHDERRFRDSLAR